MSRIDHESTPYLGDGFREKWGDLPEIESEYQAGVKLVESMLALYGVSSEHMLPEEAKIALEEGLKELNVTVRLGGDDV